MKRAILFLVVLFSAIGARAQVANVSGNLRDLGLNNATQQNTYVQFRLQNFTGIPRVVGTNSIVSQISPPFKPDGSGNISGTIQENSSITPANTFYQVCIYFQGNRFECNNFLINADFNLNLATPLTQSTLPLPPALIGLLANRPVTCTVGMVYFATDGTPGQNLYFCTAPNTWTAQPPGPTGPQGPIGPQGPPGAGGSGPTLQTNNSTNTSQTLLNLKNGTNVTMTSDGIGGVTVNSATTPPCVSNPNTFQYNSSGAFACANGITTQDGGNSLSIKGPIPFADLSAFARSQSGTTACSATATISLGSPTTATLSNNTCFRNGDGITINGAGAATGLATPVLSTITPASLSVGGMGVGGGTGTPYATVAGAVGATTDSYTLVVRDKFGGYTAASTPVSTTTALASLGVISCPLTSTSRSGSLITFNFTSPCEGAVVGAAMSVQGTTGDGTMPIIYNIKTVNSSSQVVAQGQYDSSSFGWSTTPSGANASTGGTAYFMGSNHLQWAAVSGAWYYYVCAKRSGDANYHLIGHTFPSSSVYLDLQFDDYGSPVMDSQLYPTYIETGSDTPNSNDAICTNSTGLPDPLTTTVTVGGGTTTVTLNNAATTAVSGATAKFDDGPGLLAAANSVKSGSIAGRVEIPASKFFIINSYTQLPSAVTIEGAGAIKYNETVELQSGTLWDDSKGGPNGCQFCYWSTGGALNYLGAAYPDIYISGNQVKLANMTFLTESNYNGQSATVIDGSNVRMENVEFVLSQGTNDNYLASAIAFRGTGSSNPSVLDMSHMNFTASTMTSPTGIQTWFPYILSPATQNGSGGCEGQQGGVIQLEGAGLYQRGFMQTVCNGGGEDWRFKNTDRQSGIAPFLWLEAGNVRMGSTVMYDNDTLDTSGGGFLMVGNAVGNCTLATVNVVSNRLNGGGQFQGCGPTNYRDSYNTATGTLPNFTGKIQDCAQGTVNGSLILTMSCNFDYDAYIGPNAKIYFPMAAPTSVTATATNGGSLNCANCSFQFEVAALDPAGNYSIASVASSSATLDGTCPASGKCEISVAWTPSLGEGNATVYACQVGSSSVFPQCPSYNNLTALTNTASNPAIFNSVASSNFIPPTFSLAGQAGHTASILWAPSLMCPETTAPSGIVNYDILYCDSTLHQPKLISNNGSPQAIVQYTISPTANDCPFWSGTTGLLGDAGGKCAHYTITPTNGDCVTWSGTGGLLGDAGAACGAGAGGMNTNMNNMANPTLMNQSLVPASANTIAVGTAALPFTNVFIGTVANQAGSFDTSALTGNFNIKFPNGANSTAVLNCPSVANQFVTQILQSSGACSQAQPTLANIAAGASPAGLFNFSGSTMEIPTANGFTAAANSTIGIDTTANAVHTWVNSADAIVAAFASAPAGSKCVQTSGAKGLVTEAAGVCGTSTPSSTDTFTNKTLNAESTGNTISEPVRAFFPAGGCNNTTAANGWDIGIANAPIPQCAGTTVRKGVLQFARGNVAYLNFHLPNDWNSGVSTDINICFTTTDTTNGHVTSFNIQTGFNSVTGAATDDPSLNGAQALSATIGASQTSGGELCGSLTGMTMTGSGAGFNFEIAITRNNSGTDTNTDTAVAVKSAELIYGVTKNAANR